MSIRIKFLQLKYGGTILYEFKVL